jgi:DNA-binding NtrC family response regulator
MIINLLGPDSTGAIEQRLADLECNVRRAGKNLTDLNHDSAHLVYLAPQSLLATADWAQLRVRLAQANRCFIVVGGGLDTAAIMNAAKDGAFDVLLLSDSEQRWREALERAVDSQRLWLQLYGANSARATESLIGHSPAMRSLRQAIERLGPTTASVLILGESGVGKERVASALHLASGRGSFVAVNCAAIPKELMEAELFGAEKGAYTGATKTREGLVEQAAGGTLFLDEMGEMDIKLQPKILRFLETRKARRVGGSTEIESEVRVLSATNSNLEAEIAGGKFRSDLYYRLSEVILHVPPLRNRTEDIPQLSLAFLKAAGERHGKHFDGIEPDLVRKFRDSDWPGNVRELRNAIDRMVILYDGPTLRHAWWDPPQKAARGTGAAVDSLMGAPSFDAAPPLAAGGGRPMSLNRKQKLEMARKLMAESGNDLTWVAAQLGIHPTTLYRWRKGNKV